MKYIFLIVLAATCFFLGRFSVSKAANIEILATSSNPNLEMAILKEKMIRLNEHINIRINDMYTALAILSGIIGLVVTLSWMNLVGVAKSKANEEFEKSFQTHKNEAKTILSEMNKTKALAFRRATEIRFALEHANKVSPKMKKK